MSMKWVNIYSDAKQRLEETAYVVSEKMEAMYDEIASLYVQRDELQRELNTTKLALDSCHRIIRGLGHQSEWEL